MLNKISNVFFNFIFFASICNIYYIISVVAYDFFVTLHVTFQHLKFVVVMVNEDVYLTIIP